MAVLYNFLDYRLPSYVSNLSSCEKKAIKMGNKCVHPCVIVWQVYGGLNSYSCSSSFSELHSNTEHRRQQKPVIVSPPFPILIKVHSKDEKC